MMIWTQNNGLTELSMNVGCLRKSAYFALSFGDIFLTFKPGIMASVLPIVLLFTLERTYIFASNFCLKGTFTYGAFLF